MIFVKPLVYQHRCRILARPMTDCWQATVFDVSYNSDTENVLLVPIPSRCKYPIKPVALVRTIQYAEFFQHFNRLFVERTRASVVEQSRVATILRDKVPGAVRRPADLDDDEAMVLASYGILAPYVLRMELPAGWWQMMPTLMLFPRIETGELYYPTIRHDGGQPTDEAHWDHTLYLQDSCPLEVEPEWAKARWTNSIYPAGTSLRLALCENFIRSHGYVARARIEGRLPNRDITMPERAGQQEGSWVPEQVRTEANELAARTRTETPGGDDDHGGESGPAE